MPTRATTIPKLMRRGLEHSGYLQTLLGEMTGVTSWLWPHNPHRRTCEKATEFLMPISYYRNPSQVVTFGASHD
jgi:hypothetical protein